MKKSILILLLFTTICSYGQETSFKLIRYQCSDNIPLLPDTLMYKFKIDTLIIDIIKYGHCCAHPVATIETTLDTLKFSITDTSKVICLCDCPFLYSFEIYGLQSSRFIATIFGENYLIDKTINIIEKTNLEFKIIQDKNLVIIKSNSEDCELRLYDLNSKLIFSSKSKFINLSELNIPVGFYLLSVNYSGRQTTKKIIKTF